jgi:DNA-binding CsgD family transcriptional regulator
MSSPRVLFKLRHKNDPGARAPRPWPVRLPPALLQLQIQEEPKKLGRWPELVQGLTRREIEILTHLCNGESAKETGRVLGIHYRTVESHWENMRHKSGTKSRITLALWAVKNGIVKL